MQKISAIIPTYNEEEHIAAAILSVSWADEIIVVDSFSTDRTPELAKAAGVRFVQHEYKYSAAQKNWIIPQATHPWIFLLDADERCTSGLQNEIKKVVEQAKHNAYWIYRLNHFMGYKVRYSGWQDDAVVRLFHRDKSSYEDKMVHAEIQTEGKIGVLTNKIEHFTYKNFEVYMKKADKYTTWGAYDRFKKAKKTSVLDMMLRPGFRFFKHYFIKKGFLDGKIGLVVSLLSAYNVFIRCLKLWRLWQGEQLDSRSLGKK